MMDLKLLVESYLTSTQTIKEQVLLEDVMWP